MTLDDVMKSAWGWFYGPRPTENLRSTIEAYAAEQVAQYKRDAERYRCLRDDAWLRGKDLDAAIRAQEQQT